MQSFSCHFATWVSSLSLAMFYLLLPCLTAVKNMVGGWGTIHLLSVIACFPAPFSRKKWHQRHPRSSPWPELRTSSKQLAVVSDFIKLLQNLEIKTLRPFIPCWWIWKTLFLFKPGIITSKTVLLVFGPVFEKGCFPSLEMQRKCKDRDLWTDDKTFWQACFWNLFSGTACCWELRQANPASSIISWGLSLPVSRRRSRRKYVLHVKKRRGNETLLFCFFKDMWVLIWSVNIYISKNKRKQVSKGFNLLQWQTSLLRLPKMLVC